MNEAEMLRVEARLTVYKEMLVLVGNESAKVPSNELGAHLQKVLLDRISDEYTALEAARVGDSTVGEGDPAKPVHRYVRQRQGSQHRNTHLNATIVRALRQRRAAGERIAVLAKEYNLSESNVSKICNRDSWSHVE